MDTSLFRFLNDLAGHGFDGVIVFLASYLQYAIGLGFVVVVLWPVRRMRMAVAAFASAIVARLVLKEIIILFVHRARPFVTLTDVKQLVSAVGEEYQSFPSGHALFFFALAMAIYRYDKKMGWWFFAGATLMGIARIAAGIHWPTDILAGALIGILTAELLTRFIPALRPTHG